MNQTQVFLDSEGDAWFGRNREKLGARDPVSDVLAEHKIAPRAVLEIGCGNGWRLKKLRERYHCEADGIEPSRKAVNVAAVPGVRRGWADRLPYRDDLFDLVIFGFCLYVCEPRDLFRIAGEADRVLQEGGHLIIHDFVEANPPYACAYKYRAGVLSYHMNFAGLWLAHPCYRMVARHAVGADEVVVVLRKNSADAFPVLP